jgi:hypothetical protein
METETNVKKDYRFEETQTVLLELLRNRLFGYPFSPEREIDWSAVFGESYAQGVHVTVFSNCRDLDIPADVMDKIKPIIRAYMLRDMRVAGAHSVLHSIMTEANVPYCTIKGAASASYYRDPFLRSLGDVDFLIDRDDKNKVLEIMTRKGYTVHEEADSHHIILEGKNTRMELHFEPPGMPEGEQSAFAKECMRDILKEAVVMKNPTAACVCPSELHHGLIILMHTMHHMLGEGVGLRHICDWAVFLEHMGDRFEEVFEKTLRRLGLWRFASMLSLMTVQYLGVTPRPWIPASREDEAVAYEMMLDVFDGGNFGNKDNDRRYEGIFISDRGKSGIKGTRLKEGFKSLNRITYKKWPISQKAPILLPVGWLIVLLGFARRNRERKQQGEGVNVQDVYKKSRQRRNLYESLRIYVSEDECEP